MSLYKSLIGTGLFLINEQGYVYTCVSGTWKPSAWNGLSEKLMKHVELIGNNFKLK